MSRATFIRIYKELEEAAKEEGLSLFDLEQSLDEKSKKKMQLCRLMRNYIQHENDVTFVATTDAQEDFLKKLCIDLRRRGGVCKDQMISLTKRGVCTPDDTLYDIAGIMKKKNVQLIYVVNNNQVMGYVSKGMISDLFYSGITKTTKLKGNYCPLYPIKTLDENDPLPTERDLYFVTRGKNKKIVGVLGETL